MADAAKWMTPLGKGKLSDGLFCRISGDTDAGRLVKLDGATWGEAGALVAG